MPSKRREKKASRRARQRADKATMLRIASESHSHEIDSVEYGTTFLVRGGRQHLEGCSWVAFDRDGNQPGKPVVHNLLSITRDKASKLMAYAATAEAIRVIRENMREERKQMQVNRILQAHDTGRLKWLRQEVPDQQMRSVLVGSSDANPADRSEDLVVCFRDSSGRYVIATETWTGEMSAPYDDGARMRVGVDLDIMEGASFHDESEAQRAFMFAVRMGEMPGFDETDPAFAARMADRLRSWEHCGRDMKAERERLRKPAKPAKQQRRAKRVRLPM